MALCAAIGLAEAVAAVADIAEAAELAAAVRAAADDESVLAAIAGSVTDANRLPLLRAGLFDAVVYHASAGFRALERTGEALAVRHYGEAYGLLVRGRACQTPPQVTTLDFGAHGSSASSAAARAARSSPGVHHLSISGGSGPASATARALLDVGASPWLGRLVLRHVTVDAAGAKALLSAGGLMGLRMDTCVLGPGMMSSLAAAVVESVVLERLELTDCATAPRADERDAQGADASRGLRGDDIAALASGLGRSASLTECVLRGVRLNAKGAAAISAALETNPTMRTLEIGATELPPSAVAALAERLPLWRGLRSLSIEGASLGEEAALLLGEALQRSTSLTEASLVYDDPGTTGAASLAAALASPGGSLRVLDLNLRCDTPEHVKAVMSEGPRFREGSVLRMGRSRVGGQLAVVAEALPRCPGLRGLLLSDGGDSPRDLVAFGEAMERAPWLTELGLRLILTPDRSEALARGIAASTGLTSLDLGQCGVDEKCCALVLPALEHAPSVRRLLLPSAGLRDAGAAMLGALLPRWGHSLTALNVTQCGIGPVGMAALAKGLGECSALRSLAFSGNPIEDDGMVALAEAVRGCPSLTRLTCLFCTGGARGVGVMLDAAVRLG